MDRLQQALAAVVRSAAFGLGKKGRYRRNLTTTFKKSDVDTKKATLTAASYVVR